VIEIVADVNITVVITGPIAPPTILIMFVIAEEIPVYSLGVNSMLVLINVFGKSAPAIPKIKRLAFTPCDEEWKNKSNKNEIAVIPTPGTNSFKLSLFLFATSNPKTGPKIIIDRPKGSCKNPTFSGSNPNPNGVGGSQLWNTYNNDVLQNANHQHYDISSKNNWMKSQFQVN
jgi:hypothetical protein